MAAAVPEQLLRAGFVGGLLLLLLLSLSRQTAGKVVANCSGDWLPSRDGWACYRVAPNYELYHKVVNDTLHLGLDVWPGNDTGEGEDHGAGGAIGRAQQPAAISAMPWGPTDVADQRDSIAANWWTLNSVPSDIMTVITHPNLHLPPPLRPDSAGLDRRRHQ